MGLSKLGLLIFFLAYVTRAQSQADDDNYRRVFNVVQYGAVASPSTDSTKAFSRAWQDACAWRGKGKLLVPPGTFILSPATFRGPCNGQLNFRLEGVIRAHPDLIHDDEWISFQYLNRFILSGGGTFDALADMNWFRRTCGGDGTTNSNCLPLPVSIGFSFLTTSRMHHITSLNSKNTHINIFGCDDFNITKVKIIAPDLSPNTDGIRMGRSSRIGLSLLYIGTGDDCVSMLGGTQDVKISDIVCGPGHGISVGSLGKYQGEANVKGISVRRTTFVGTTNGVRIKTWAASRSSSSASGMLFEDIQMKGVANPIIIDQDYCPYPPCYQETPIQVQISDVTFRNIWGVSDTPTAVFLRCSRRQPCQKVTLQDISLAYSGGKTGRRGPTNAVCYNVGGQAYGRQNPPACI